MIDTKALLGFLDRYYRLRRKVDEAYERLGTPMVWMNKPASSGYIQPVVLRDCPPDTAYLVSGAAITAVHNVGTTSSDDSPHIPGSWFTPEFVGQYTPSKNLGLPRASDDDDRVTPVYPWGGIGVVGPMWPYGPPHGDVAEQPQGKAKLPEDNLVCPHCGEGPPVETSSGGLRCVQMLTSGCGYEGSWHDFKPA